MKPIKRVLTLKPPRTRSRTEMSCSEANVIQESDEVAEPDVEAISKEDGDVNNLSSNKVIYTLTT